MPTPISRTTSDRNPYNDELLVKSYQRDASGAMFCGMLIIPWAFVSDLRRRFGQTAVDRLTKAAERDIERRVETRREAYRTYAGMEYNRVQLSVEEALNLAGLSLDEWVAAANNEAK